MAEKDKNTETTTNTDEVTETDFIFEETGSDDDYTDDLSQEDSPDLESDENNVARKTPSENVKSIQENAEDETKEKFKRSIYVTKKTLDAIEHISKQRNVSGSKVVEFAVALYFKNYFERDFVQISDFSIFTSELAALAGELTNEAGHLGELASRVLDAEMELPTDMDDA